MLNQQNFSTILIQWYQRDRAEIQVPGRQASSPYAIWIAEVMLQQTQVSTVKPYYKKWLEQFPSVASLAQADLDQVLKLWEGLGYYSRARNLHKAAQVMMAEFAGKLPEKHADLLKIPGIGPYTAAAIASIAFKEKVPLIDGNVLRVFARLNRIEAEISQASTRSSILEILASLIPGTQPDAFNQGLMDLGRMICKPKNPLCEECPVSNVCQAYQSGDVEIYPVRPQKKTIPHYEIVIGLIQKGDEFLIQKRPASGLLGGLWEFPGGKIEQGESAEAALLREIKEETALNVSLVQKIGTIKHAYTHFKITMTAYFCDWTGGEAQTHAATENRWVARDQFETFAFPKANLKILDLI